jgi:hypothetical protein
MAAERIAEQDLKLLNEMAEASAVMRWLAGSPRG